MMVFQNSFFLLAVVSLACLGCAHQLSPPENVASVSSKVKAQQNLQIKTEDVETQNIGSGEHTVSSPKITRSNELKIVNPSWRIRKGAHLTMCRDLESLLNDLPGSKQLGASFPFSHTHIRFRPVHMKAVHEVEAYSLVLNEWWEKEMSRYQPPKNQTKQQRRDTFFRDIKHYASTETPLLLSGFVELADEKKVQALWYRPKENLARSDREWWQINNDIGRIILIAADGTMDPRSVSADAMGYPIYYHGRYRVLRWGGAKLPWSDKASFSISAADVTLANTLIKNTVCNIDYQFEMEK